jgi:hypothetical protein
LIHCLGDLKEKNDKSGETKSQLPSFE